MQAWIRITGIVIVLSLISCATWVLAQETETPVLSAFLALPTPRTEGGMPLMDALKLRQTKREFSPEKLSPQTLSNLLWAACGVNRADSNKRTAPSAMNMQEIDVYVAMEEGLYRFNSQAHNLQLIVAKDLRALTGKQAFVASAPLNLIYVADLTKMKNMSAMDQSIYTACDTGFICQNVYLFCASEGMATVVRGSVDREALSAAMGLEAEQRVILAQSVGSPKK